MQLGVHCLEAIQLPSMLLRRRLFTLGPRPFNLRERVCVQLRLRGLNLAMCIFQTRAHSNMSLHCGLRFRSYPLLLSAKDTCVHFMRLFRLIGEDYALNFDFARNFALIRISQHYDKASHLQLGAECGFARAALEVGGQRTLGSQQLFGVASVCRITFALRCNTTLLL